VSGLFHAPHVFQANIRYDWIGAGSVLQHVVAHSGRTNPPLFRAAITSSTFLPPQYAADDPIPTLLYNDIVESTNCSDAEDTFACLVAIDSDTLNQANNASAFSAFYGTYVFVPVVDGTFITERPTVTLGRQVINGDVLLSVTNTFEGDGFALPTETNTTDYVRQMFPYFSAKQTDQAASYYIALNTTLPEPADQAAAIMGECSDIPFILNKRRHLTINLGRENLLFLQVTTETTCNIISLPSKAPVHCLIMQISSKHSLSRS